MDRNKLTWGSCNSVKKYKENRYKNPDQRLVSYTERRLVRNILSRVLEYRRIILDIPCGYGRFSDLLSNYSTELVSADLNIYALNLIRDDHRHIYSLSFFEYVNSDILSLPFKCDTFDLVFCFRLLQHFKGFDTVKITLRELIRVSRRYVLFSIYIENPLHRIMRIARDFDMNIFMISKDRLRSILQELNVRIIYAKRILPYFHANTIILVEKIS